MKKIISILLFIFIIMNHTTVFAQEKEEGRDQQVLVLHSYHKGLAWTDDFQKGIEELLQSDGVELIVEYMDSYRSYKNGYYKILYDLYKQKYSDKKIDVVLVIDNFAYDFMKEYHEALFPGVPIVFGGINNFSPKDLINSNSTGIAQSATQEDMIQLILKLHPDVESIVVTGEISATALAESNAIVRLGEEEFPELQFKSILKNTFEEVLLDLKYQEKNTVIIAAGTIKDRKGNFLNHSTFSSGIINYTKLPVYALATCYIQDYGAIGGAAVDPYVHGKIVAGMANRILKGERASRIKIIENPIWSYTFDYYRMKEFKIDKNLIPKDSIILNSPENKLVIDKDYARLIVIIMVIMVLFIIGFIINNRKRKIAEKIMLETKNKLKKSNIELEENNQFLRVSKETLKTQYIELAEKNEKIEFLAYYDPLTKLMNRNKFCELLKDLLPSKKKVAIYNMHLRNIKTIYDTYGHEVGNEVLLQIASLLTAILDKKNYLLGVYHNEYLIADLSVDEEGDAIKNVEYLLSRICKPFRVYHHSIDIAVNIGIAIYPEHGQDYETLLKCSNLAMIEASKEGKNIFCVYNDNFYMQIIEELEIEKKLKRALVNQEFLLHYQPKINGRTGEIIGLEALIRWKQPDGTIVFPNTFIEIAERKGLINEIGDWVLFEACRQIKAWESMGISLRVSVNVSAKQLTGTYLFKKVEEALKMYQVDPKLLELEITETAMMFNLRENLGLLYALRKLNIGIALDDFGTGYSSMNYIKELPITKIKIDKSFIDHITLGVHREIVNSMIVLGHAFCFEVNVEGVETLEQLEILREYNIDELQGFLFSKALPKEQIPEFIKSSKEKIRAVFGAKL